MRDGSHPEDTAAGAGIGPGEAFARAAGPGAVFDAIWRHFAPEDGDSAAPLRTGPDWAACLAAAAAYAGVIAAAWRRVARDFETHRTAIGGGDWEKLGPRWFAIAEAEFIATQRRPEFLAAQRDLVRALGRWHADLPGEMRAALTAARRAAARTANVLPGLETVEIATTPRDTIWREGTARLDRYRPLAPRRPELGALVICHGLIGRQTMTDLVPDRSLVRQLLAAGLDVFAVDWGEAGPEAHDLGIDHHAGHLLGQALGVARGLAEGPLTLMGICQGGTLAACHLARHTDAADRLITAVAPFDFHADGDDPDPAHGLLHLWLRSLEDADIEGLIAIDGNLSGALLGLVFCQLNPVGTLAKYGVRLPGLARDRGELQTFLAMERWLADRPDVPGALARTWLIDLYRHNRLVTGGLMFEGAPVDLSAIAVPVLNVLATGDHISPGPCVRALGRFIAPERYRELALPTGHIGAFVGRASQPLLGPGIVRWLDGLARTG